MNPTVLYLVLVGLKLVASSPLNSRILNGDDAAPEQFPYMASLGYDDYHFCGASVLTKRTVLTAGHCLEGDPKYYSVYVGSIDVDADGARYKVADYIVHPNMTIDEGIIHDIGIVYLEEDLVFSPSVQPIEIDSEYVEAGQSVVFTGWGSTNVEGTTSILQYITLKTITQEDCQARYNLIGLRVDPSHVCTFNRIGEGLCLGDSGGPLVKNGKQVGVSSWYIPCALIFPDGFSRISTDFDWIKSVTI